MIAVVVINYRRPEMTLACLSSLYASRNPEFHLFLIDNGSTSESRKLLRRFSKAHTNITLLCNSENLGFARACNQAFQLVLAQPAFSAVALLNNDSIVEPNWLSAMLAELRPGNGVGMVACRMMSYSEPDKIDSLGIVLYKSGIASNRKRLSDPLLGPCGGAAVYSTTLLHRVQEPTGYIFDPAYFCYAEDTDLALRARIAGFQCAYANDAVVRHHGSASSGGGTNEFVAYYGLRNSLLTMVKGLPGRVLARHCFWITLMQFAIMVKYLAKAKPRLLWRVYRDFTRLAPSALSVRRRLQGSYVNITNWDALIAKQFYESGYIISGLLTLHRRDIEEVHL